MPRLGRSSLVDIMGSPPSARDVEVCSREREMALAGTTRRAFTTGLAAASVAPMAGVACAQPRIRRGLTVKFVVPFPAGGAQDIVGRVIADRLGALWKVPTIVENVPGAGGNIGIDRSPRTDRRHPGPDRAARLATNQFLYPTGWPTILRRISSRSGWWRPAAISCACSKDLAGSIPCRADRPCQGQSGQAQLCVLGYRHDRASLGRAVQAHGRRRDGARGLSRQRAGAQRPRRPKAST